MKTGVSTGSHDGKRSKAADDPAAGIKARERCKFRIGPTIAIRIEQAGQPHSGGAHIGNGELDFPKILLHLGNVTGDVTIAKVG